MNSIAPPKTLVVDDEIRRLILLQADSGTICETARKNGMKTLLEDGLAKAASGLTSLAEVVRVCPSGVPRAENNHVAEIAQII